MELVRRKGKKGLIFWTWERCRSFGSVGRRRSGQGGKVVMKSKSWPSRLSSLIGVEAADDDDANTRVAPEGCFSVYVGAEKQRFCIKTKCLKHPLFKTLLQEAESEYGYTTDGPLELPCEVDLFIQVLLEMDFDGIRPSRRCSFSRSSASYQLLP